MSCEFCDRAAIGDHPYLFVWPGQRHALGKLRRALAAGALRGAVLPDRAGIRLDRPDAGWAGAASALEGVLSALELSESRVLAGAGPAPGTDGYARVTMADRFIGDIRGCWLHELMDQDRLTSWFQPIVDRSGRTFGHEALARGNGHDGAPIGPQAMLQAAATPNLLARFDRQARMVAVREAGRAALPGRLFVNFVPSTIYDPQQCLRSTVDAVERFGLDPESLVFEVVESYRIDDMAHLKRIFDSYRAHGFGVALDDFGAGYATLEALFHLRPDFVKLDKELGRRCATDRFCRRLVEEIVRLAHDEQIQVVAEGIEDPDAFALLRDIGADLFQGWHFGRPAPAPRTRARQDCHAPPAPLLQ